MNSVTEIVWKDIQQNEELEAIIEKVIQKCFEVEHINPTSLYICVTLTNPKNIREINKEYRNIDKETDVLSFPIFTKEELQKISCDDDQKKLNEIELGDIILCNDVIREHAKEYGTGLYRETLYMITHAMFHLLGYDHEVEEDKKMMRTKEEVVLSQIGEI